MKCLFTFHYSNCITYLICFSLSCLIVDYIYENNEILKNNTIFDLLLMYVGESLAIIFYLCEKSQFIHKPKNVKIFSTNKYKDKKF